MKRYGMFCFVLILAVVPSVLFVQCHKSSQLTHERQMIEAPVERGGITKK
ncbi:MAG: hypothetical protein QM727_15830 [Niabella sp.]